MTSLFQQTFGAPEELQSQAPGRLEILGNHTDYNEGYVLSMAADYRTTITWRHVDGNTCRAFSPAINDGIRRFDLDAIEKPEKAGDWTNYIRGVIVALRQSGHKIGAFDALVESNVPLSAGMSSSASLEMAIISGLVELFNLDIDLKSRALAGQWCENHYIGANTGLMDQLTSLAGRENQLLISEYRAHQLDYTPLSADLAFVVANSGVKHDLSCEYNERRQQCENALAKLQEFYPDIKALRDVTLEQLQDKKNDLESGDYQRALHVVGENTRVLAAQELLAKGDFESFGKLLFNSHESSKKNFENSCPELDILVDIAGRSTVCLGARLSGGGFGGISIHLVRQEHAETYAGHLRDSYFEKTGIRIDTLVCTSSYGAGAIVKEISI